MPGKKIVNRLIQVLAALITFIFYRLEIIGEAIPGGPLLLVMNHPNALLDPAVLLAGLRRPVRFLAKSTLFTRNPLGWIVRNSGAIPVYRPRDAGVDVTRNVAMFAAVQEALTRGEAVGLFPEGISHSSGRLEPLRMLQPRTRPWRAAFSIWSGSFFWWFGPGLWRVGPGRCWSFCWPLSSEDFLSSPYERETKTLETIQTFLAESQVRRETLVRFQKGRNELADLMEEAYQGLQSSP